MTNNNKVAVIGSGSWATAIVKMLTDNIEYENNVNWFIRNKKDIDFIKKFSKNPKYISSIHIDTANINFYNDINEAIYYSDILFFAIPSAFLRNSLSNLQVSFENKFIVSGIKGLIPDDNLLIADFFHKCFNIPYESFGVLSGPCHAEEIAMERLSYLTISSLKLEKAETVANLLENRYLKTSISDDIYGTEYAATLKNVYAIASGISQGLGYGDNFQAVLISNAIQEIKRFVDTVHPISRDIKSSAYLGDLLVTAYSKFSRNRTFGVMLGKGYSVKSAQLEMNMIAEGFYSTKSLWQINKKYNIYMPILDMVYNIIYNGKPPAFEFKLLTDKIR